MRAAIRRAIAAACAAAALLATLAAFGQGAAPSPPPADAAPARLVPAPLIVYNRPVALFRSSFLGFAPSERAATASKRIDELLARGGPGVVATEAIPQGISVSIDGALAFVITPGEVDALQGETLDAVAGRAAQALERVMAETREARDLRRIGEAVLASITATAVFGLVVWGLAGARRRAHRRLDHLARTRPERLRLGGVEVIERERALGLAQRVSGVAFWTIVLVLAYEWLGFVLERFPYTRPWGEQLNAFLVGTGARFLRGIADAVPELVIAVAIFLVARFVVGLLGGIFDRVQGGHLEVAWLDRDTVRPTRRLASIVVWLFALVMAYPYLPGANTDAFKGVSVLVGLMISIGGASIVGQGVSGLVLMYARTVRPGEYVRIGEHEGTVVEVGMFYTRIRTALDEELTLPSGMVTGNVIKNYSRAVKGAGYVLDTSVTIGYDTPWRQVQAMLLEGARRTVGILSEPAPRVFQTALSDFYVEYRLVCQAVPAERRPRAEVLSQLHQHIQDVFNEFGVQIMSPHYVSDPEEAKLVPEAKWYEAPAVRSPAGRGSA